MNKTACGLLLSCLALTGCLVWEARAAQKGEGTVVSLDGLRSKTPAEWKEEEPPPKYKQMRLKQFRLPRAGEDKEDAELILSYFGPKGGGDLQANIERWKGQFTPPPGKSIEAATKVEKMNVSGVAITSVDIEGTYKGSPFEKADPKPNHRVINIFFDSKNGPYFIRLVGPAKTVASHKKSFDEWLKNFK